MNITVFCSDPKHHVWPSLRAWCARRGAGLVASPVLLMGGDLLILVSCTHIVNAAMRARYRRAVVLHESDLPNGRGWSPLAWQILEGNHKFCVSLIECADPVDSGAIIAQRHFELEGHELSDEINAIRDQVRLELMDYIVAQPQAPAAPQRGAGFSYPRRRPEDSRLQPNGSIASQFELLRICDPRFPAFFDLRGHRYEVTLKKAGP